MSMEGQGSEYVLKMNLNSVLIIGDFNALVGKIGRTKSDRMLIGDALLHEKSNGNGEDLTNLMRVTGYKLNSSFLKSNSLLFTRQCGVQRHQVDHVLLSPLAAFDCLHMSGPDCPTVGQLDPGRNRPQTSHL